MLTLGVGVRRSEARSQDLSGPRPGRAHPAARAAPAPAPGLTPCGPLWCRRSYFNAYASAARAGLDFWLHLGDFIYEYEQGHYPNMEQAVRWHGMRPVGELLTLQQYRQRYALTREDADLQAMAAPLITTPRSRCCLPSRC